MFCLNGRCIRGAERADLVTRVEKRLSRERVIIATHNGVNELRSN